jgi:cell division septation protein DedD
VNTRYLEDEDIDSPTREREISLGATTILGIFLLLALVCAVFFGFGYSMGRRSSLAAAAPSSDSISPVKTTGATKPNPGLTPAINPSTDSADANSEDAPSAGPQLPQPAHAPADAKAIPAAPPAARSVADSPQPAPEVSKVVPQPAPRATTVSTPGAPVIVQVAAVSHQEDADMLLNALKRRGYDVAIRHEPQDKLLHIQLGPYPTRKDADVMRQRLLADGYNAIVK